MEIRDPALRLATYRQRIDNLDAALVHILAERFRCTDEVGMLKAEHGLPARDEGREGRQFARARELAMAADVDQHLIGDILDFVIAKVVQRHQQIAANHPGS